MWNSRNSRGKEFMISLCNPSGGYLPFRQSCNQNSAKHQLQSSSAKTANDRSMLTVPTKRLHHRLPTGLQVQIWLEVLWVWGVSGLPVMHGIRNRRLGQKELVEVGWNYKKSYFWWPGNPACGDSTGIYWIGIGSRICFTSLRERERRSSVIKCVWSAFGPLG